VEPKSPAGAAGAILRLAAYVGFQGDASGALRFRILIQLGDNFLSQAATQCDGQVAVTRTSLLVGSAWLQCSQDGPAIPCLTLFFDPTTKTAFALGSPDDHHWAALTARTLSIRVSAWAGPGQLRTAPITRSNLRLSAGFTSGGLAAGCLYQCQAH